MIRLLRGAECGPAWKSGEVGDGGINVFLSLKIIEDRDGIGTTGFGFGRLSFCVLVVLVRYEHIDYVMDIIKNKYINSPERMNELLAKFPMLFDSYEEVKKLLYMTDIRKEFWGKRPLSKLTYDIDKQLEKGKIEAE